MIDYASSTRNMAETREKTRFAGDMATMIQLLDNNIARDAAIQKVCVRLNILESDFRKQVARLAKSIANQQQKAAAGKNGGNGASGSGASGATDRPEEAELPPPHPHARQMIRLAVTSAEVLALIRTHAQLDALAAVPGCELLELVFKSQSDLSTSGGLSAFLTTLTPAEERAFSRVVAEPPQRVSIETALQTLQHIEFQGLENLYQNVTTRLRQPGLAKDEVILLQQEVIRLKGEIGVRRAQLPSKQDY